jgi:hypothetical protein
MKKTGWTDAPISLTENILACILLFDVSFKLTFPVVKGASDFDNIPALPPMELVRGKKRQKVYKQLAQAGMSVFSFQSNEVRAYSLTSPPPPKTL